ncbi:thiol-disulfide oxidoreductase DCC family protein [Salisediminibacterium halotolerans]|uniref:Predicted thiol-disulfide oxidoreductase YuxK, DCC family n=1 Tax=Salisediminibacterium halotolerans TaxID=517425 RepID=A0A1H9RQA2_9BACI|nr:DCC1-like thiol-disulfide oxidoreductase family protein [Salisediminibacterium haloalkalitolerans]SER74804.1 Predicted thiol-disulfide oxidoreductase YuxK, DCC family [Salisediminibacterium haloalkalitolerans]
MKDIILFDGVCNLCHRGVQFIIKRDRHDRFRFASLQSETASRYLPKKTESAFGDSIVLIEASGEISTASTAVITISRRLHRIYFLTAVFLLVPKPFRDACYRIIARNRYRWFGKKDACPLPSPEQRNKFLE